MLPPGVEGEHQPCQEGERSHELSSYFIRGVVRADMLSGMEDLRYPIGKFQWDGTAAAADRARFIDDIARLPSQMREAVAGLEPPQLDTPYRPGGWTARQVVHHVADSHMNSYVRFKLALTEDEPTIKPYDEARWAEIEDGRSGPPEVSLALLDALHQRWVLMLRSLAEKDWLRRFRHPDLGLMDLNQTAALYSWHGRHHTAHITSLRRRIGWI
jgi:hypothetical protein